MINILIKKIFKKIKQYDTIVIARHTSPDPDAIASQISLRDSIKLTFPKKKVYAVGAGVSKFKYFGGLDKVDETTLEGNTLLIACDVPNKDRIDGVDYSIFSEMFKIDHHPSEEEFGDCDWVDESASSACQMIIELLLKTPLKYDRKIAENLFLGVVSDSDRFLLSYTTYNTFYLVGKLIEKTGIDFVPLYHNLYDRSIDEIRFHGYIGENLTVTENGLAYIKITPEILKKYNVDTATPSNMINDFSIIKDVYAWVFITYDEKNEIYKINIRSKGPIINSTAAKYGGGGHKMASGIRLKDKDLIPDIIKDLDLDCLKYKEDLVSDD